MEDGQNLIVEALQRYLRGRYTTELRRKTVLSERGWDTGVWAELADIGFLGIFVAQRHGGIAASPSEIMGAMELLGRYLVVEPILSTAVIGGSLFSRLDDADAAQSIMRGSMRLALASNERPIGFVQTDIAAAAERADGGYRLNGEKFVVRDAPSATHLVVSAKIAESGVLGLFLVGADNPRLSFRTYRLIDDVPAADVRMDRAMVAKASLLAAGQPAIELLTQITNDAAAAVCGEAIGVMRAMLEQTVAYTSHRKQFGAALKEFQALQHRMADMYVEIEQACSSSHRAYLHAGDLAAVSGAKIRVNQALRVVSHESVQMHGAIGTTDELQLGAFFRRAAAIQRQYGSTADHYPGFERQLLQEILAEPRGPASVERSHRASA
jgi:alkylation response protein AidB-like acyl-CoA dehydrogenase